MIKLLGEGTEDYDLQTNLCIFRGKRNQTVLSKQEVFNTWDDSIKIDLRRNDVTSHSGGALFLREIMERTGITEWITS